MDLSFDLMSEIIIYGKYARYLPELNRRESWQEICHRNRDMHLARYPMLHNEIVRVYDDFVMPKHVLPSMRSMQFGGRAIEKNESRVYNCSYLPIDHWKAFSEIMFLLLGGTGVGYSVQFQHIDKLPEIHRAGNSKKYLINDSLEGWADAVRALTRAYFLGANTPDFDYSDIRPKGAPLKTAGGKAPGPEPLKKCLNELRRILSSKRVGEKLSSIEVHDMICHIADAVLAGGIRRSAMIALFSLDDELMLNAKSGNWYRKHPQRERANNSAVVLRHRIKKPAFLELFKRTQASGSGEPGIYLTNNQEWLTNPCGEVSLRPNQFCNLCEINGATISDQLDFENRAVAASFLGTLQAGYTDFHYLRDTWIRTTKKDALLGVGMTGIAAGDVLSLDLTRGAEAVLRENARVAQIIGINEAARTTLVKPSGTTSLVLGSSSGIHAWFAPYYLRRVTLQKNEALYGYLSKAAPELIEQHNSNPNNAFVCIPMKAPDSAICSKDETALQLLDRVKHVTDNWVKPGYRDGHNGHNISATVYVKDQEWGEVSEWMWANRDSYNGLTLYPHDGAVYEQTPFEEITEKEYTKRFKKLHAIDLTEVREEQDNTDLTGEAACAGGACELK